MKAIAKLMLVTMLLFWAHRAQATTTFTYCDSANYAYCMNQCYVPWVQATEYCPHGGTLSLFCYDYYAMVGQDSPPSWALADECIQGYNNSCIQTAAGNLSACVGECGTEWCTTD